MSYEQIRTDLTVSLDALNNAITRYESAHGEAELDEDSEAPADLMLQSKWRIEEALKHLGGRREP